MMYKIALYIALLTNIYYHIMDNAKMIDLSFQSVVIIGILALLNRR